jgi:hypothetical protein
MIRKSAKRFSGKIMLKHEAKAAARVSTDSTLARYALRNRVAAAWVAAP